MLTSLSKISLSLFELHFRPGCCDKDTRLPVGEKKERSRHRKTTIRGGQTVRTIWHRATWNGISVEFLILICRLFISYHLFLKICPLVCGDSNYTILSESIGTTMLNHLLLKYTADIWVGDQQMNIRQQIAIYFLIFTSRCYEQLVTFCLNSQIFRFIKNIRNL